MKHDAAPSWLWSKIHSDLRVPEPIHNPFRPGEVHPARQLTMIRGEGVVWAVAKTHRSVRHVDLWLVPSSTQEVQERRQQSTATRPRSSVPACVEADGGTSFTGNSGYGLGP